MSIYLTKRVAMHDVLQNVKTTAYLEAVSYTKRSCTLSVTQDINNGHLRWPVTPRNHFQNFPPDQAPDQCLVIKNIIMINSKSIRLHPSLYINCFVVLELSLPIYKPNSACTYRCKLVGIGFFLSIPLLNAVQLVEVQGHLLITEGYGNQTTRSAAKSALLYCTDDELAFLLVVRTATIYTR